MASQQLKLASQEPKISPQDSKLASQEPKISPQDSKLASQGPKFTAHEPKLSSKESNIATQEPKLATQETKVTSQEPELTRQLALPSKYSNRVVLKTILERIDGGLGLVGERMVIGGWVKSSKEVIKEPIRALPPPQPEAYEGRIVSPGSKEVSCAEILQCRIPLFRSIMKILGGTGVTGGINHPMIRDKLEPEAPLRPRPSIAYLLVGDGSCVAGLQLMVESSIAFPCQLLPIGTCVVAEGVLRHSSEQRKHNLELKVEKILHIGTVEQDTYPLSKKRVPLESLRDCPHFRPRTTTVASVMRIRSALTFATHTFFQNHGYLCVQVPIITTTDAEGFSEKFQVTTSLSKEAKTAELNSTNDIHGASLEVVKAAVREKSNLVEELKRTDSNREALAAALQDLQKTNKLVTQLEAREKLKPASSVKADKVYMSEDFFFPHHTYLNVSGLLHLESFACALGNVYSFGPRFQANRKESAKKVAEMWMVEVQMAFSQLEDSLSCASDYFKFLCKWVLENCSEDMKFVTKRIDRSSIDRLQSIISGSHEKISYMEAVDILKKVTDRVFETKLEWGVALTAEHLSYLADERYKRPIIIYNYPKEVKPFYVRLNSDGKTVAAFDMVLPKVGTFITGSQSEERANILDTRIKELGLAREQYEWYLDLRRHGTVKHSGFSLGFDLMVLFATGLSDVRDTIPFPRSYGKASS